MRREDYFAVMDCVTEEYAAELMRYRRPRRRVSSGTRMSRGRSIAAAAAAAALLGANIAFGYRLRSGREQAEPQSPSGAGADLRSMIEQVQTETGTSVPESSADAQDSREPQPDVQEQKNLWLISETVPLPENERRVSPCISGAVYSGEAVQIRGRTVDFRSVTRAGEYAGTVPYCVSADGETLYFASGDCVYRSELSLSAPAVICRWDADKTGTGLRGFSELRAFRNTGLLFFRAERDHSQGECLGTLDPETGELRAEALTGCKMGSVLCNTGLLLYEQNGKKTRTAYYWECGTLRKIRLRSQNETDTTPIISANGRYICTVQRGATKDGRILEHYRIYDLQAGKYAGGFERFSSTTAGRIPDGTLSPGYIDESRQCLLLARKTDLQLYEFRFGASQ